MESLPNFLAQVDIGEEFKPPGFLNKPLTPGQEDLGIGTLVSILLSNAVVLAGVILLLLILVGGLAVIASAGGEPERAGRGKKAVGAALVGFLIIFAAFWIIRIIELLTGLTIL